MRLFSKPLPALLLAFAAAATAGCLRNTEPAQFYQLQAVAAARPQTANAKPVLVGVGPIKLASYLDRPQIVVAEGPNRLQLDEFQRWSEPLQENLTRVIAENLSRLRPENQVMIYPWHRNDAPELQLEARVDRFHTDAAGNSALEITWSLAGKGATLLRQRSSYQASAQPHDMESLVSAQSQLLASFARDAAAAMDTFRPSGHP